MFAIDVLPNESLMKNVWRGKSLSKECQLEITFTLKLESDELLPQKVDVRNALYYAIRDLHGTVGLAVDYELSSYNVNNQIGTILVYVDGFKKLWSSVTFIKEIESIKCFIVINDVKVKSDSGDIPSKVVTVT